MTTLQRKPSTTLSQRHAGPSSRAPSRQGQPGPPARAVSRQRPEDVTSGAAERNIQVVVRCRALSWQEIEESSEECVTVEPVRGSEVTIAAPAPKTTLPALNAASSLSTLTNQPSTKSYAFDHVFGPSADQGMVFNEVAAPMLEEVLQGYNCTCLCYGQTGTGKTYTSEGSLEPSLGTFSPSAGLIPRALHRLFEMLNKTGHDYAVKVSFVELYNEELRDLNAPGDMVVPFGAHQPMSKAARGSALPSSRDKPVQPELRILDDNSKRGVVVQGVEETHVANATEGIRILTRGSQRRQAASTQLNEHSSRSHSIFTITVHVKATSEVGEKGGSEDHLKTGKLHLVDLAGSENVGRSGAQAGRAREAGMINQSLLSLGRVINALVERNAHVPYRESKLTRILQDSLGGRTKTCIIATISPAQVNYDETLSTLDYALRAKAIQNRPEANQRMTKAALLSQYSSEIERLKADLYATRTKTGIYISDESWSSMGEKHEETRKEAEMQRRQAGAYQMQLASRTEEFEQCCRLLGVRESELKTLMEDLDKTNADLAYRNAELQLAQKAVADESILRQAHDDKRREWKDWAGKAIEDTAGLREKIARKHAIELANIDTAANAEAAFGTATAALRQHLSSVQEQQKAFAGALRKGLELSVSETTELASEASKAITAGREQLHDVRNSLQSDLRALNEASAVLASATEHTRTEFIDDARERADDFRSTCTQIVDGLLEQQQQMLEASFGAMERVLQEVERGHAATVERLEANIAVLEKRKEAESARMQAELDRLEGQNQALAALQSQQTAIAATLRQSLLDTFAAQVDAMLSTHDQHRQTSFIGLQELHDSSRVRIEQDAAARATADEEILANERAALQHLTDTEALLEEAARDIKEHLESTAEAVREKIDEVGVQLNEEIDANERAYALFDDMAAAESSSYRETATGKQSAVAESLAGFVSEAATCFETVGTVLGQISDSAEGSAKDTKTMLAEHLSSCDTSLAHLASGLSSLAMPVLRADIATGRTPRQRDWPHLLDEDELEGGREQLLARLRETATTPVPMLLPEPSNVAIPPSVTTKLEIPLGVGTAATAKPVVRRSVLGEKLPNQATGKRGLQDSINRGS